jgi:hypothetical protein
MWFQVGKYDGGVIHWPVLPHIEYPSATSYGPHNGYRQLIGGHKLRHVSISGGTIDGGGKFWYKRDGNKHRYGPMVNSCRPKVI